MVAILFLLPLNGNSMCDGKSEFKFDFKGHLEIFKHFLAESTTYGDRKTQNCTYPCTLLETKVGHSLQNRSKVHKLCATEEKS